MWFILARSAYLFVVKTNQISTPTFSYQRLRR